MKYSLKKHLLEDTSPSPNKEFLEGLKLGGTDGYWTYNGTDPTDAARIHSFSYEATPECILGVDIQLSYNDVVHISRLMGSWGPNEDYDTEYEDDEEPPFDE